MFTPLLTVCAGAVTYPDGVTKEQVLSVIPKINTLAKTMLNSGSVNISSELYKALYSDSTVNSLFEGIYSAMEENADTMSVIGVDISPAALAKHLDDYPEISKKIASCKNLGAVIKASKNFKWGITSQTAFGKALAAILSPFNSLLNALLCSGTVKINDLLSIKGDDGYSTAIVPLLEALDCPEIMTSSQFSASASKNHKNIILGKILCIHTQVHKLHKVQVILF